MPTIRSRYRGAMLGLAIGDALGTTLEFAQPGHFEPVTDMVGGGPFDLAPGQWTDDTSMALCLAESLIECRGFDAVDQMQRYVRWFRHGYRSSTGECFDVGATVAGALRQFERTGNPRAGLADPAYAGNGSLMRLAPVPLAFAQNPSMAIDAAADMSRTTHAAPEPVDACRYYAGMIVGALNGVPRDELLAPRYAPIEGRWQEMSLAARIDEIAAGSFKARQPPDIRGAGYVVRTLEAALWGFWHTDSFEDGLLKVVNLGEDADTTGAIYGQLAGAYFGAEALPASWRERLTDSDDIVEMADALYALAKSA